MNNEDERSILVVMKSDALCKKIKMLTQVNFFSLFPGIKVYCVINKNSG